MTDLSYVDVRPGLAKIRRPRARIRARRRPGRELLGVLLIKGACRHSHVSAFHEQGHRLLRRPAIRARVRRAPRRRPLALPPSMTRPRTAGPWSSSTQLEGFRFTTTAAMLRDLTSTEIPSALAYALAWAKRASIAGWTRTPSRGHPRVSSTACALDLARLAARYMQAPGPP